MISFENILLKKLSKNFSLSELGGVELIGWLENLQKSANALQTLRDHIGTPLQVTSGFRSEGHNRKVGGTSRSQHLLGLGFDIKADGLTSDRLAYIIKALMKVELIPQGGVGIYDRHVHVDFRGTPARWSGTSK